MDHKPRSMARIRTGRDQRRDQTARSLKPDGMLEVPTANFGRFDVPGTLNVPLVNSKVALQVSLAG